ncbi:MAG: hypothetical protein Q7S32_03875 [bacterium]|nr:hypothetical protein [bacterium]
MKPTRNQILLFKNAVKNLPAYRKFLVKQKIRPQDIRGPLDWTKVPIMTKENYFGQYKRTDFFNNKRWPAMIYASSGSSGRPTFWFRGDEQEERGGLIHEEIFRRAFEFSKTQPTLVIVCFSMGVWVAGQYTTASCRYLARQGYNVSVISPGVEKEDIFTAWRELGPHYKNIVLAGYPPFILDVVREAKQRGINFGQSVKILTAGDKFDERWRENLISSIGNSKTQVLGIYGSADSGAMGYETPLSIFIRRHLSEDRQKAELFWGKHEVLPGLVQYDPKFIFFENVGEELVLTTAGVLPLIRYNIHDRGKVLSFEKMKEYIKQWGWDKEARKAGLYIWIRPFLVLGGRTDVAVTFYALNIYPEHVRVGLEEGVVNKWLSGNFSAHHRDLDKGQAQELVVRAELAPGIKASARLTSQLQNVFTGKLREVNIEYRKLFDILGEKAKPLVELCPFGKMEITSRPGGTLVQLKGKKPRKVL